MEIISRKDARAANLSRYFTGAPCINNHLTYRYTQSGTCAQCVSDAAAAKRGGFDASRAERRAAKTEADTAKAEQYAAARREYDKALQNIVEIRLRAYPTDLRTLNDTAKAMGNAHYPNLREAEFGETGRPSSHASGTALYRFRVASEDIELMRATANALFGAHKVDIEAARRRILQQVTQIADEESSDAPDGWA